MGRHLLALAAATLVIASSSSSEAFPLEGENAACADRIVKGAAKVLKTYGKTTVRCLKGIGRQRSVFSDVGSCVQADSKNKLAAARARLDADVDRFCGMPYEGMFCPAPCAGTDDLGVDGIESTNELKQCLQCLNPAVSWLGPGELPLPRGVHGAVLDGVSVAPPVVDARTARCQADIVKSYEKLFATSVKEVAACLRSAIKQPTTDVPPVGCIGAAAALTRTVRMRNKLAADVAACGTGAPFDAGVCAGVVGDPQLTACLDAAQTCGLCVWGHAVVGASDDCDAFDDGQVNGSCSADPSATSTTTPDGSTTTLSTPTTSIPDGTTTTTIGATTTTTAGGSTTTTTFAASTTTTTVGGTTTTTLPSTTSTTTTVTTTLAPTTTTTLPSGVCGTFVSEFGSLGVGNGQFDGPRGVTTGPDGTVYVVDSRNDRMQAFTPDGTFLARWGSFGSGAGEFDRPRDAATDASGNVYVADRTNHRIQKFGAFGAFIIEWGVFGVGPGQFNQPQGVAVDGAGNVYVADGSNHRIQKFTSTGAFISQWGGFGAGNGQFNTPRALAVDAAGNVYVADRDNNRIQKFTSTGGFITTWGGFGTGPGQMRGPRGVAIDDSGDLLVADTDNNRIQKFTPSGGLLDSWGSFGAGPGQFNEPHGVAFGQGGAVYVSDRENARVQRFLCPAE